MDAVSMLRKMRMLAILGLIAISVSCSNSSDQETTEKKLLLGEWQPASPHLKNHLVFFEESSKLFMKYKNEQVGLTFKDGAYVQDHSLGGRILHKGDSLFVSGSETYYIKNK